MCCQSAECVIGIVFSSYHRGLTLFGIGVLGLRYHAETVVGILLFRTAQGIQMAIIARQAKDL